MTGTEVEVVITFYPGVLDRIARSEEVRSQMEQVSGRLAEDLRRAAPVRTGALRASIEGAARAGLEGWIGTASWDEAHYYGGILNSRTHWAEAAAQRVRYV